MIIFALTMYVDDQIYTNKKGKSYRRVLLRHSFRVNGKTKQKNIANISNCSDEEIAAVKFALKNRNNIDFLKQAANSSTEYWKEVGASVLLYQVAKKLGINKILGREKQGDYILWQVMARLIYPGSRLETVRLARAHCGCELIGLDQINENDLYDSLVWLYEHKEQVEKKIFKRYGDKPQDKESTLFLYDVSSSYLEGKHNELAAWGYNRDKKKGKKQIVYGLLTNKEGYPLSVEAFQGNTQDPKTVAVQIKKIKEQFGCKKVVFVGDKGMIKQAEIEEIQKSGLHYLTTITKPQIRSLIKKGTFQLALFTDDLIEVKDEEEGIRYVLRRNSIRAEEMKQTRAEKIASLEQKIAKSNLYLKEHDRAKVSVQEREINKFIGKLKMTQYIELTADEVKRELAVSTDEDVLEEISRLDGCYAMKTDVLEKKEMSKEALNAGYKSLAHVEWAFRTQKSQLCIRPVYLRKEHRTKGHLMVCMMAYMIEKYLRDKWKDLDLTVKEGIDKLSNIVGLKIRLGETKEIIQIGKPDEQSRKLLEKAEVVLPDCLPARETHVSTKEKLVKHRN